MMIKIVDQFAAIWMVKFTSFQRMREGLIINWYWVAVICLNELKVHIKKVQSVA